MDSTCKDERNRSLYGNSTSRDVQSLVFSGVQLTFRDGLFTPNLARNMAQVANDCYGCGVLEKGLSYGEERQVCWLCVGMNIIESVDDKIVGGALQGNRVLTVLMCFNMFWPYRSYSPNMWIWLNAQNDLPRRSGWTLRVSSASIDVLVWCHGHVCVCVKVIHLRS